MTDANGNVEYSNPATLSLAMQEWQYEYNADGLRTMRTDGYSTYEYVYLNGQLVRMLVDGNTLSFHYDADGKPMSFVYNGTTYYYATNLQGDIVAILSKEGTQVVAYSYDAWGNVLSVSGTKADTVGKYNPLRYRGYVYDTESCLYYLQSRYYDPAIGRFINADSLLQAGDLTEMNMFAYCANNPVNYVDPTGEFPWLAVGIAILAVVAIGVDHWLAANQPDGGYVLEEEITDKGVTKKGLYAQGSGFTIDNNGVTVCDMELGLFSGAMNSEHVNINIVNVLSMSAIGELDWSGIPSLDISAVASIYNSGIEATFPLGPMSITISEDVYLGGIGGGFALDIDSGKFKFTPPMLGIGHSYEVDIDVN